MTLDPSTASLCRDLRPEFATLATERVQEEWAKLYVKSTRPELAVKALQDSGWDDTIPGLKAALADARTVKALARLQKVDPEERIPMGAAMVAVAMAASDRKVFLNTTVLGKDAQTLAEDLVTADPAQLETPYARKSYAYTMAKRGFTFDRYLKFCGLRGDLAGIRVARAAIRDGIGAEPEAPYIQGRDVMAAGSRKPGPWVGALVAEALERQYRGEFSDQDAALAWLENHVSEVTAAS
jgi:tRNA nucleotidyltransferase/poly(A) polymerase